MTKIPSDVRELLTHSHTVWVATTGPDGMPNVSIKASGTLLDEEHLYFADMYSRKTRANLEHDPRVAVGVYDEQRDIAVQLKGTAELIVDGALFSGVTARLADLKETLPPLKYVVKITVESVWDMAAGPHAGEAIGLGRSAG
jgi:predicted pyridoxine 5'-phosphate oxidase superfamily flavin-nucleotide-binding protein